MSVGNELIEAWFEDTQSEEIARKEVLPHFEKLGRISESEFLGRVMSHAYDSELRDIRRGAMGDTLGIEFEEAFKKELARQRRAHLWDCAYCQSQNLTSKTKCQNCGAPSGQKLSSTGLTGGPG